MDYFGHRAALALQKPGKNPGKFPCHIMDYVVTH